MPFSVQPPGRHFLKDWSPWTEAWQKVEKKLVIQGSGDSI